METRGRVKMHRLFRISTAVFFIAAVFLISFVNNAQALSYTVNTTDDVNDGNCDGAHCSLREAIIAAEANAGPDTINFNIPACGSGCTITPGSPLPTLAAGGTTINGYSQPVAAPASGGTPATILIHLVTCVNENKSCLRDGHSHG